MASIDILFDKKSYGSVTFAGTEQWVNLLSYGPNIYSPILSNTQVWTMYVVCITTTKSGIFELRSNLIGKSAGTVEDTMFEGITKVPADDSKELDVFYNERVMTKTPLTPATGVENLWLRIKTPSSSSATYEFVTYYTII